MAEGVTGEIAFFVKGDEDAVVAGGVGRHLTDAGFDVDARGVWRCTCDTAAPLLETLGAVIELLCAPKQFAGAGNGATLGQLWCTIQRGQGKDEARTPHALLVDDDPDFRAILRGHLEKAGYRVSELSDATSLVAIADGTSTEVPPPDVITLDVMMPTVSGAAALDMLSRDKDAVSIPVVLVSNAERERVAPLASGHPRASFIPKGSFAPIVARVMAPHQDEDDNAFTAHVISSALFDTETEGLDLLTRKAGFVVGASGVFENRDSAVGPVKRSALSVLNGAARFDAERGGIHRLWFAMRS